jgi:hypothetical protein
METPQQGIGRKEGPATFETVWAALQETDRIVKEVGRKQEETAQQMKETDRIVKETARQMKETDKRVGALTNRFGEVIEYMIVPNLISKFNELGYTFTKAYRDTEIKDKKNDIFTEIDVFMENGDCVMIVETKTKPNSDDIDEHIERMEKLRVYADLHNDKRKYYGAIAGVVMGEGEKNYALKKGFYIIEPSGETFAITMPEGIYAPRAW